MAGMLDFKPALRLGATATISEVAVELLEQTRQPERPAVWGEHSDFRLKNAENIPLEFGFVEPQAGIINAESRPEARDFARPVPRIELSYAILIPAFGPLKEPLPVESAPRNSEPAIVWSFGGLPYVDARIVERGSLVESGFFPTGVDGLNHASTDAPRATALAEVREDTPQLQDRWSRTSIPNKTRSLAKKPHPSLIAPARQWKWLTEFLLRITARSIPQMVRLKCQRLTTPEELWIGII